MTFLRNIPTTETDKELVAAFKKSGEMNYLSVLYQRYMDLVFGVCLKYFKDAERSKDAVMEIFEELNTKLRQHEVENFKGWLHVLAPLWPRHLHRRGRRGGHGTEDRALGDLERARPRPRRQP